MSEETQGKKPESDGDAGSRFIREKVEPPKKNRKRSVLKRGIYIVTGSVAFGLIASLTFVLSMPWMEEHLGAEEETEETVVIPRDDETQEETEPETEAAPDRDEVQTIVEEGIRAYMETYDAEREGGQEDEPDILETADGVLKNSIVTVTSRSVGEDVFRNSYTRSDQTFGVVLAKTDDEAMILTEDYLPEEDSGVLVSVGDVTAGAELKSMDTIFGMAVISVKKQDLEENTWDELIPAALGNSYSVKQGDEVAVIGAPLGYTGSEASGTVAYVNTLQQEADRNIQVIQTDIAADTEASGLMVNAAGQIVGWVTQNYNSESMGGLLAAVSISDVKGYIENMTNGRDSGYLGIRFRTVTSAIAEAQQMPQGIYITKCISDSPAYEAGLKNGDIITAVGGETVQTEYDFERLMEGSAVGDTLTLTVMRQGRNGYTEMTYDVELSSR